MKIFIELPTWLGDSVMATPAIENLINFFNNSQITLIGSVAAIEILKHHPKVTNTYVLPKNYYSLYKTVKGMGNIDVFFSFRNSFRSKFMKFFISSKRKYQFNRNKFTNIHQVEKYNNFVNRSLNTNSLAGKLILHTEKKSKFHNNKLLGINPGASYGEAKRWYPKEFANVAIELSSQYDIIIFGGPGEKDIANDIENYLNANDIENYQNLAGKTSIDELISQISMLDLFITGDSGPMHLAAAFQIPTVSIFGPTRDKETSQWMNDNSVVVKKNYECQPCMKRICPLNHNNCMKLIESSEVIQAVKSLNKV
jgi:heptosyltransferase II